MSERSPARAHSQPLSSHFERVAVLSLPAARARRERLRAHLEETGLGGSEVQFIPALPGTDRPPPNGWQGLPAWGCLRSHLSLLRQAQQDGIDSLLILEDDVVFHPRTAVELGPWLRRVPPDWGQIYLGGQHLRPPRRTALSDVWQARNVNRAHAYAVSARVLPRMLRHLTLWQEYNARRLWHVDHQYGLAHERGLWSAYTPAWWFAGQAADTSQICGSHVGRRWWQPGVHALDVPFVYFDPDALVAPEESSAFMEQEMSMEMERDREDILALLRHLQRWAVRALDAGALPAWRNPALPFDLVARIWPAGAHRYVPGCADALFAAVPGGGFSTPSFTSKQYPPIYEYRILPAHRQS
jgi:hypothetical protein